jgi:hypothetical protein
MGEGGMMIFERWRLRSVLGLLVLLLGPGTAVADLQRVEAVGSYGISEKIRKRVTPRDEAVQRAVWEGVSRVALEEIGEFSSTQEDVVVLRKALGEDMLPYTRSFRILEDKGESPVLFEEDPNITTEYIVVVEVLVDVDRVRSALDSAGLIADGGVQAVDAPILVELIGVGRHDAFEAIRDALISEVGAVRVETLGFARERQLLSVVGPFGPDELSTAMQRLTGGGWSLETIGIDEFGRRIRVQGLVEP